MAKPTIAPDYGVRDLMTARLTALRPTLEAKGVRHAFLFGSICRGDDVPESDVDIIVELDSNSHVGLFEFSGIAEFLEDSLGRSVDLGTRASLSSGRFGNIIADLHQVF